MSCESRPLTRGHTHPHTPLAPLAKLRRVQWGFREPVDPMPKTTNANAAAPAAPSRVTHASEVAA